MKAIITNIQGFSIHDGPGIRTVVFFKGCPLSCKWCANPECISKSAQIGFVASLCEGCGKCFTICPVSALRSGGENHRIDYARCTGCGKCADICDRGALVRYGKEMSVSDVFESVRRDKMFYDDSGGGVTVSGGEPLLRPDFVRSLFEMCRADGIGTCVETSGFTARENLLDLLPLIDYLLFDLKLMESHLHYEYTGQQNEVIMQNAALASEKGANILFRVPLIPRVNDNDENIEATARFIRSLPNKHSVQLMPYHRLGDSKYRALDIENHMHDLHTVSPEQSETVRRRYESCGVDCTVSS